MNESDSARGEPAATTRLNGKRLRYDAEMRSIREHFQAHAEQANAGATAVAARSAAVDDLIQTVWAEIADNHVSVETAVSLVAVGGYGRGELFPHSDVDLLILLEARSEGQTDARSPERAVLDQVRHLHQMLWDCGLRISAITRSLAECERFEMGNVEATFALLDARWIGGDKTLFERLTGKILPKVLARDRRTIMARLLEMTRTRHAKHGETLFHLEPNVKEGRGGLRDAHVCRWMATLDEGIREGNGRIGVPSIDFVEATQFLVLVRTFLHFRHERDDNTLDWQAQDAAAQVALGAGLDGRLRPGDAAWWMRHYFRNARSIERRIAQFLDQSMPTVAPVRLRALPAGGRKPAMEAEAGFTVRQNRISLNESPRIAAPKSAAGGEIEAPAHDPEVVLALFAAMARTGARLMAETDARLEHALPLLSANLEDGPNLWRHLQQILLGSFAGRALRTMHALGILELLIPEFHGIDALVIRDAYHRYTVDEHTFVVIDTLQRLAMGAVVSEEMTPWESRFAALYRDLPHPELLLLAALLHDTGKGHAAPEHSVESARMAANVLNRLEVDAYESGLVLELIRHHLEMSAALRRDVFDHETIRAFAARVPNPEGLRMLALFTFADIAAVHPDALTPWKAENLWRLYQTTAHFLDRSVDEQRVARETDSAAGEVVLRIHALLPGRRVEVTDFLEGFPSRYLQTRTPEMIAMHVGMAARLDSEGVELDFRWAPGISELTLVTTDRPRLFAAVAGTLAAWGMNIVTADAFSNANGVVVDSFRFTDTFRTLELNESERERFLTSMRMVITGQADLETLLQSRRRSRRRTPKMRVETRIVFDQFASTQRTLLEVIAQDTPGLLRAVSLTLAEHTCNIEVALIDTEGEMAIDVFYITRQGGKLETVQKAGLEASLLEAIERNAE